MQKQCCYIKQRFICWAKAITIFNFRPVASLNSSSALWTRQTLATKMLFVLPHLCFVCSLISPDEEKTLASLHAVYSHSHISFACLAQTPNSERPERCRSRLFYPHPQPSGMTSCLCYLAPDIKLMIPIAAPFL